MSELFSSSEDIRAWLANTSDAVQSLEARRFEAASADMSDKECSAAAAGAAAVAAALAGATPGAGTAQGTPGTREHPIKMFPRRKHGDTVFPLKRRPPITVDLDSLKPLFHLPQPEAAKKLGISLTSLKMTCRRLGVNRWPYQRCPLQPEIDRFSGLASSQFRDTQDAVSMDSNSSCQPRGALEINSVDVSGDPSSEMAALPAVQQARSSAAFPNQPEVPKTFQPC